MNINFLYKTEFSVIGTLEPVLCGIEIDGRKVSFTGDSAEVFHFGITAKEVAMFATGAESVHFEHERVYVPVRDRWLNEKVITEEISVLTVRAIAHGEVVKSANLSRVVSRW